MSENRLKKLRQRHAQEEAALMQELEIERQLPDLGVPWRIHVHELWGSVASATAGSEFPYWQDEPRPTLDTVRIAAALLQPQGLVLVNDGCLSFRPASHVESLPESAKKRWQEESTIAPFVVSVIPEPSLSAEFCWYSRLASGTVIMEPAVADVDDRTSVAGQEWAYNETH